LNGRNNNEIFLGDKLGRNSRIARDNIVGRRSTKVKIEKQFESGLWRWSIDSFGFGSRSGLVDLIDKLFSNVRD
jgi:hypothetical protein